MAKKVTTKNIHGKGNIAEPKMVTVYGTEKSEFMVTGKPYEVSKKLSETLVKNGSATLKKK